MGYDAGKKVKGRKLHALVDVEGLPLRVIVHSAGIQDRDGATLVLDKIRQRFPWLELVWADAGYNAHQVKDAVARSPGLRLEIIKRTDDTKGFVVLPRRWVVERTFSWFGRNRRLAKDYENLADTLAAFVTLAAIQFAIRRLARLVLLCHKLARWQQGQRGKRRAMLRASLIRIVAIDALMWRSARIGGSAGSITRG